MAKKGTLSKKKLDEFRKILKNSQDELIKEALESMDQD